MSVHPDMRGLLRGLTVTTLILLASFGQGRSDVPTPSAGSNVVATEDRIRVETAVRPGVEVFLCAVPARIRHKRVAFITNQYRHRPLRHLRHRSDRAAHKDLKLVALLAPEHGIRGNAAEGATIADEIDPKTGVPISSLYAAEDRGPTPEMLKDVDVLRLRPPGGRRPDLDLRLHHGAGDAGGGEEEDSRSSFSTGPTRSAARSSKARCSIPKFKSFVGMYPIPARHGMTVGELATLFNRAVRHRRRPDRGKGRELAALAVVRRNRAAVGEPVAQPALVRRAAELSRDRVLRGHQPHGGARHRPAVRADRRVVAERAGGRARR